MKKNSSSLEEIAARYDINLKAPNILAIKKEEVARYVLVKWHAEQTVNIKIAYGMHSNKKEIALIEKKIEDTYDSLNEKISSYPRKRLPYFF
ncbi:MAG: hypothetical protein AABW65_01390 [Nanoarchaeota archaeon]